MRDEKETFLAGRQEDVARKKQPLSSLTNTAIRGTFCTILQNVTKIDIKSQNCTLNVPKHRLSLPLIHKWVDYFNRKYRRSQPAARETDRQRWSKTLSAASKFHWALVIHPALIIHSNMVGETTQWNLFDRELICFLVTVRNIHQLAGRRKIRFFAACLFNLK